MRSGVLAEALGESPYKVLKDVAAVNCAYLIGAKIAFRGVELLDNKVERIAFDHALYNAVKVELGKHVLHICRESGEIVAKIDLYVIRVSKQLIECVLADIVELISGSVSKETLHNSEFFNVLICSQNFTMGRKEAVMETLYYGHRKYYKTVFVRLERTAQHICNVPDHC